MGSLAPLSRAELAEMQARHAETDQNFFRLLEETERLQTAIDEMLSEERPN